MSCARPEGLRLDAKAGDHALPWDVRDVPARGDVDGCVAAFCGLLPDATGQAVMCWLPVDWAAALRDAGVTRAERAEEAGDASAGASSSWGPAGDLGPRAIAAT